MYGRRVQFRTPFLLLPYHQHPILPQSASAHHWVSHTVHRNIEREKAAESWRREGERHCKNPGMGPMAFSSLWKLTPAGAGAVPAGLRAHYVKPHPPTPARCSPPSRLLRIRHSDPPRPPSLHPSRLRLKQPQCVPLRPCSVPACAPSDPSAAATPRRRM